MSKLDEQRPTQPEPSEADPNRSQDAAAVPAQSPEAISAPQLEKPSSDSDPAQGEQMLAANAQVLAASRQQTRRSFLGAAAAVAGGFGLYHYISSAPTEDMQPLPLQHAYAFSASVSRTLFPGEPLAPTYSLSRAENLRINGIYGLKRDLVPESWRMQVVGVKDAEHHPRFVSDVTAWEYRYQAPPANTDVGHDTKVDPKKRAAAATAASPPSRKPEDKIMSSIKMAPASMLQQAMSKEAADADTDSSNDPGTGRKHRGLEEAGESDSTLPPHTPGLLLELSDITRLPRIDLVTQFKCIEGWSQIVHWAGVRMADFLELYPPALLDGKEPRYVYMETPDGDYYTGYDMHVMRHPQTLLVTEMMGAPLTQKHGAPLRLHMPTKYGYKQIKRIGLIAYTNTRPDDYWTKLGYDWYAGL